MRWIDVCEKRSIHLMCCLAISDLLQIQHPEDRSATPAKRISSIRQEGQVVSAGYYFIFLPPLRIFLGPNWGSIRSL